MKLQKIRVLFLALALTLSFSTMFAASADAKCKPGACAPAHAPKGPITHGITWE